MDRKKTKKIRSARIVATNIFMSISVVAIVAVLMLIAMGFSFNESGDLQQSGLLQISSQPSRATVEIDGEQLLATTEINKMVNSGEHNIKISKPGYDTWQKRLNLEAGLLTRIEWVRLFPVEQNIENVDNFKALRLASYSSDNKHLLLAETGSPDLYYINLQGNEAKREKLPLASVLSTNDQMLVKQGAFSISAWNDSNNKVILRWLHEDQASWHLVDLSAPSKSINLSEAFNFTFDKIVAANDSASELWALENGNLHLINTGDLQISGSLASGIENFASNKDTVAYVAKQAAADDTVERALYTFKEGEDGSVKIFDLKDSDTIVFSMGTYWGDEWIAYALNNNIYLLAGKYPSYKNNDPETLKKLISHEELAYVPSSVRANASKRIIAFWSGKELATLDVETRNYYDLTLDASSTINWLDNYLLWESTEKSIIVRDFDGTNRREIINTAAQASHVAISGNNQWLYYVEPVSAAATENSDNTETAPQTFLLKRLKLSI